MLTSHLCNHICWPATRTIVVKIVLKGLIPLIHTFYTGIKFRSLTVKFRKILFDVNLGVIRPKVTGFRPLAVLHLLAYQAKEETEKTETLRGNSSREVENPHPVLKDTIKGSDKDTNHSLKVCYYSMSQIKQFLESNRPFIPGKATDHFL